MGNRVPERKIGELTERFFPDDFQSHRLYRRLCCWRQEDLSCGFLFPFITFFGSSLLFRSFIYAFS